MNIRDQVLRGIEEYKRIRGMTPDTLYLTETAFLYLLLQVHAAHRDQDHCAMLDVAVKQGAVEAARRMRFAGMRVVIKEETSKSFFVRHTGEVACEPGTADDLSTSKCKSLFAQVFGPGGLADRVFGGKKYE